MIGVANMKRSQQRTTRHQENLNDKVSSVAWIVQTFGMTIVHIVLTALFVVGAYMLTSLALVAEFWLMTVLAIVFIGISIMGVAAVVMDVCHIVAIYKEMRTKKRS
jgi:uncharacterized membrane protein YqjE